MRNDVGTARIRHAAVAGLVALLLGSTDALATRNCVSNMGKGRSTKIKSLRAIGLTRDGRLLCFSAKSADKAEVVGTVSGLGGSDTALIGIDFRVQDGKLYGVGNGGGVYTIDPNTAQATFVNQLTVALDPMATSFGVDFNPAADRLRIISDTGQNLRHNVNAGGTTATDAPLTIAVGTAIQTATGVTGAAYTNNDLPAPGTTSPTGTTLYDIATATDQVVVQSPPNGIAGGAAANLVPSGNLTVDAGVVAGFDIYSVTLGSMATGLVAVDNLGFAVLNVGGTSGFYSVNFQTGQASLENPFREEVVDVALPLNQN